MKLLTHREYHRMPVHCHHKDKKGYKIMRKMAKLEKKLSKYSLGQSDSGSSTSDEDCRRRRRRRSRGRVSRSRSRGRVSRSRSRGESRGRNHGHQQEKQGKRSNSSDSVSSDSTSSSSLRSPSPPRHHRHHHGPRRHLSDGLAFPCWGRYRRGPLEHPHGPPHHHEPLDHPHGPPHHRGRLDHPHGPPHHRRGRHHRHLERGIPGLFAFVSQSEAANVCCEEVQPELVDLSENAEQEEIAASNFEQMNEDVPEEEPELGSDLEENLAKKWTEIIQKGLSEEKRTALIRKYPVNANCLLLQAPKVNKEILAVAPKSTVERDRVRIQEQNQIGTGLAALGQALTDLEHKIAKDKDLATVYDTLGEAAEMIIDAHRNMTQARQELVSSGLHRKLRSYVENCHADCLLYGEDFGEKVKDVKGFGKARKDQMFQRKEGNRDDKRKSSKRSEDKEHGEYRLGLEQQ